MAVRGRVGWATVQELTVVRTDRGVQVACEKVGLLLDGVEHFLAALGGLGLYEGVSFTVEGGELPLADGGALAFAELLRGLQVPRTPPHLRIEHQGEVTVGDSHYTFEPSPAVELGVDVHFDGVGAQHSAWDGTPETFIHQIAWARTFGFEREAALVQASGRGRGADPRSVMILDDEGRVREPGRPQRPDELARHKLLDLVGDLYLGGGPPRGRIAAVRPGHGATRRALLTALDRGIIAPARATEP